LTDKHDNNRPAIIELVVAQNMPGKRLDRFLAEQLPQFSRSRIQQLIRGGSATLNGESVRPRDTVRRGDVIRLIEPPLEKICATAEAIPLDIIFEDDDLVVLNKPAGMVVHPGAGHREHTLVNALLSHCSNLSGIGGKERPGIVHRLDKETSGCLVVAKNDEAHRALAAQFATRTVSKVYLALVSGKLRKPTGSIEERIGRHPVHRQRMSVSPQRGREAKTEYSVIEAGIGISLVECRLHSGRTHQIRVHLHHIGHPVIGDKVYGKKIEKHERQMLHAWKLGFRHPRSDEWKEFEASTPDDFRRAMRHAGLTGLRDR
jgi:23S rRNA pseudouridine1911/1915/1917 synthase